MLMATISEQLPFLLQHLDESRRNDFWFSPRAPQTAAAERWTETVKPLVFFFFTVVSLGPRHYTARPPGPFPLSNVVWRLTSGADGVYPNPALAPKRRPAAARSNGQLQISGSLRKLFEDSSADVARDSPKKENWLVCIFALWRKLSF